MERYLREIEELEIMHLDIEVDHIVDVLQLGHIGFHGPLWG